ncbi:MAG: hypothetical protein ACXVXG_15020 [Nocardioidaceae bacterium]
MTETSSLPRRFVHLTFECAVQEDGTPMWAAGHPAEVVAREFGGTGVRVEITDDRERLAAQTPERRELLIGWPNRVDGARVVVLGRTADRIRLRVLGPVTQPGTELERDAEELVVGELLSLTRTWRVVSIEPPQSAAGDLWGAGGGQLAAVLELVAP